MVVCNDSDKVVNGMKRLLLLVWPLFGSKLGLYSSLAPTLNPPMASEAKNHMPVPSLLKEPSVDFVASVSSAAAGACDEE